MMHEGAEDIVFRLLCCVVHCLVKIIALVCIMIVQSYCMVMHIELLSSSSYWRGSKKEQCTVFKSLCCVVHYLVHVYCIGVHNGWFIVLHGGAYWIFSSSSD